MPEEATTKLIDPEPPECGRLRNAGLQPKMPGSVSATLYIQYISNIGTINNILGASSGGQQYSSGWASISFREFTAVVQHELRLCHSYASDIQSVYYLVGWTNIKTTITLHSTVLTTAGWRIREFFLTMGFSSNSWCFAGAKSCSFLKLLIPDC